MRTSSNPKTFDAFRRRLGHVLAQQVSWKKKLEVLLDVDYEGPGIEPIFNLWEEYQDLQDGDDEFDQTYFENIAHDAVINFLYPVGAGVSPEWVSEVVTNALKDLFTGRD